jgi:hypothetical protein
MRFLGRSLIFAAGIISSSSTAVFAQSVATSWLNPIDGNWSDPARWSTNPNYPNNGTPPGANYSVDVTAAGSSYQITLGDADDVSVTWLKLRSSDATVRQTGGTFLPDFLFVASGRFWLSGGTLNSGTDTYFGRGGVGTFLQTGGIRVQSGAEFSLTAFGETDGAAGVGTMIIDGAASRYLLSAGTTSVTGNVFGLGTASIGNGIIRNGAYVELGDAEVGVNRGTGTLSVESGAQVTATGLCIGTGFWFVGSSSELRGNGTVLLDGPSSRISIHGFPLNNPDPFHPIIIGGTSTGTTTYGSGRLIINNGTFETALLALVRPRGVIDQRGGTISAGTLQVLGSVVQSGGNATCQWVDVNGGSISLLGGTTHLVNGGVIGEGTFGGSLVQIDGGTLTSSGSLALLSGNVRYQNGTVELSQLSATGGLFQLSAGGTRTLLATSIDFSGTAQLDLSDNRIIVDYSGASPLASVRSQIQSGFNNGDWSGSGIMSSTAATGPNHAIGFAEAFTVFTTFPASFGGYQVDNTSLLVRYTRYGDANLDGIVSLSDFNALAANFGILSGALWTQGDFNYDGKVNLADFNKMASNFGLAAIDREPTPHDWQTLAAAVPEPASVGLLAFGAICARCRRRTK